MLPLNVGHVDLANICMCVDVMNEDNMRDKWCLQLCSVFCIFCGICFLFASTNFYMKLGKGPVETYVL